MRFKTGISIFVAVLVTLFLAGWLAFETGLVRWAFYELFARVKGVDVLGQTIVRVPADNSPYERWLLEARSRIPVLDGMVIENVNTVELRAWPQLGEGINGLYLRFADYQIIDGRIVEIPVGGTTAVQQHLYEKGIYFLTGSGYTLLYRKEGDAQRIEWNAGDLFSVPLNVRHQHVNAGTEPIRLLAVTSFPFVLNATNSEEFISENLFEFTDRYDGDERFTEVNERIRERSFRANFVDDILNVPAIKDSIRGPGAFRVGWEMADNTMIGLHVSHMEPGAYKKAHRHSSDAFILLLSGEGYSITWPESHYNKRRRVDWQPGTLFVPPIYWYHQHLNTGSVPARFLAINASGLVTHLGLRFEDQLEQDLSGIRKEWEKEVEKNQQD